MKKIILTSVIAASSLFAASNEQIINFYKQIVPSGVSIEIASREKIAEHPQYEGVVIRLSDGKGITEDEIVFTTGDFLLPEVLDLKTGKSYKTEFGDKLAATKIKEVYKNEDPKNIIVLGNDPKKPTEVMFSDPECPYCRLELKTLEKRLEKENLKIILTPVHEESSLAKSYLIYKESAKAKSDSEKVKILRKYFDENFQVKAESITPENIVEMDKLRQKYFSAGVRSVPKIINEATLK